MFKKTLLSTVALAFLSSCGGTEYSTKVESLQRKDKRLSCQEILLEMNEAEFHRQVAHKNKGPRLKSMLMPLGYISTYMSAEHAIEAADARVSYLDKIYEILRCEEKEEQQYIKNTPAAPAPVPASVMAPTSFPYWELPQGTMYYNGMPPRYY